MDNETGFICALLSASEEEQQKYARDPIPVRAFSLRQTEVFWLYEFYEQNSTYPTPGQLKRRFPGQIKVKRLPGQLPKFIGVLNNAYAFSQLNAHIEEAQKQIHGGADGIKILNTLRDQLNGVKQHGSHQTVLEYGRSTAAMDLYADTVEAIHYSKGIIDSPWKPFNDVVPLLFPGEYMVIAARTSIGKTWMTVAYMNHVLNRGNKVLYISREMSAARIELRFDSLRYRLPYPYLRFGNLPPALKRKWIIRKRNDDALGRLVIVGNDSDKIWEFDTIEKYIERYDPAMIMVDGAYKFQAPQRYGSAGTSIALASRYLSNAFQELAARTKKPLAIVLQENRDSEDDKGGKSKSLLKNIYGGDSFAQDADYVVGMSGVRGSRGAREITLSKGRDTGLTSFEIEFDVNPPRFPVKTLNLGQGGLHEA